LDHDFTVIGISETHLKEKPHDKYNLPGYNMEYINRVGRNKGGVCMYISKKVKYKTRNDLCNANSNYESCFVEIERKNAKNIIVGVLYRAHTSVDNFTSDIDIVLNKIGIENKMTYIMGDFNIDLLKDDTHRPIHDYLDLIYSHSMIPTIYKPTRITENTATIIDKIIDKFDPNKSSGHDDIGSFIIKKVANEIVQPLTAIFNLSLSTGFVPKQLKVAKIIPIHKKDDAEIYSNYRPISLLPCFSKILERLVFNRSIEFIDNNNILNEKQYGFRANHSTYMAIMQLVDKVTNAVENNETTIRPI